MENEEELQKVHLNRAHSWLTHEQLISAPVFEFILDLILVLLTHRNPHASHRKKRNNPELVLVVFFTHIMFNITLFLNVSGSICWWIYANCPYITICHTDLSTGTNGINLNAKFISWNLIYLLLRMEKGDNLINFQRQKTMQEQKGEVEDWIQH